MLLVYGETPLVLGTPHLSRRRLAVPLCPHCHAHTMYLDSSQTRWLCASAACAYTCSVVPTADIDLYAQRLDRARRRLEKEVA